MVESILCGVVVGISLGLTGGGGSIFAVPLLLFVLDVPLREAVAVSLSVVGLTALYGAAFQRHHVQWRAGATLGLGGVLGAPFGAALGSHLPELATLLLFSVLMIFVGLKMWRNSGVEDVPLTAFSCRRGPDGVLRFHWACAGKLGAAGALTGLLSGIFGVGGGFLVVPALLIVTAMPIKHALATSLVCIVLISAAALSANLFALKHFPIALAGWFLLGGAIGMTAAASFKSRLSAPMLKKLFAAAIFGVALWILAQQLFPRQISTF